MCLSICESLCLRISKYMCLSVSPNFSPRVYVSASMERESNRKYLESTTKFILKEQWERTPN